MSDSSSKVPLNDEAIESLAANWLLEEEEGFTPEQLAEFERWQALDSRHRRAVAMLRETCGILERMPLLPSPESLRPNGTGNAHAVTESPKVVPFHSRRLWSIAAALAACIAFALGLFWLRADRPTFENTYATTAGGYLRVNLPDASVLELNADSEVRVRFVRRERQLALTRGEAHFSVAKNPAQPFVVTAAGVVVRAVGTAFNVRIDQSQLEVLVTEGRVRVDRDPSSIAPSTDFGPGQAPELGAGEFLRIATDRPAAFSPSSLRTLALDDAAIRRTLAWQIPRLQFNETPLAEVVEQFNQRNRVQLELADPALAKRPVGGTFRADGVETFVQLLEKSGDITVERPNAYRIVLRRSEIVPQP